MGSACPAGRLPHGLRQLRSPLSRSFQLGLAQRAELALDIELLRPCQVAVPRVLQAARDCRRGAPERYGHACLKGGGAAASLGQRAQPRAQRRVWHAPLSPWVAGYRAVGTEEWRIQRVALSPPCAMLRCDGVAECHDFQFTTRMRVCKGPRIRVPEEWLDPAAAQRAWTGLRPFCCQSSLADKSGASLDQDRSRENGPAASRSAPASAP